MGRTMLGRRRKDGGTEEGLDGEGMERCAAR